MQTQNQAIFLLADIIKEAKLDLELKKLGKSIFEQKLKLHETMVAEKIDDISPQGVKFEPIVDDDMALADDIKERKFDEYPPWFEWLEDNGHGDLIKTKKGVHHLTRKSFWKEYKEGGGEIPDFVKEVFLLTVKYNKAQIKRIAESELKKEGG